MVFNSSGLFTVLPRFNVYRQIVLVDGSSCELRHYLSFKDPLLSESLHYPLEQTEYQRRILEQEGHSPFSQILLWASPFTSPVNPQNGPGIPTVNYESADGKEMRYDGGVWTTDIVEV